MSVFIDAANILYSQQTLCWRIDYHKLKTYFERECDLVNIHFYTGQLRENRKQTAFLEKLTQLGYIVKAKEVKRIRISRNTYQWKGNLDIELAIDVLANMRHFDTLVLMSGDSDFAALLDTVKIHGKRVIVMSAKEHVSKELLDRAKYININKLRAEIRFEN